jgi:hypothetical protein
MQRKRRWWRYGALFGSAALLLQTASCAVDDATMQSLVLPLVTQFVTAVASGAFCPTA